MSTRETQLLLSSILHISNVIFTTSPYPKRENIMEKSVSDKLLSMGHRRDLFSFIERLEKVPLWE